MSGRQTQDYRKCRECRYYKGFYDYRKKERKRKAGRYFKLIVAAVVIHGMICVTMSYILAWMERTQVVEGVSSTIITEIIAPIIVYGATKTIENIFQKNRLSFSEPIESGSGNNETKTNTDESEVCG